MRIVSFIRIFLYLFWLPNLPDNKRQRFYPIEKIVKQLRIAFLTLVFNVSMGITGYIIIEGASFLEAYYMTVITISTVGFTEVFPLSDEGRIFTSLLILINLGLFTYAISTIVTIFADPYFSEILMEYSMLNKIKKLQQHTIVCGFGRHAVELTSELEKQSIQFVIIENDRKKIEKLREHTNYLYIDGDATIDSTLIEAGIENAHSLVITLPSDADNIFIVIAARQLQPRLRIICRANIRADETKLRRAGADHVVMPEKIGGFFMATLINKPDLVEFFTLLSNMGPANVVFEEMPVQKLLSKYQGKTIAESHLVADCQLPVVAIRHPNGQYELNPPPQTYLHPDIHIVMFGSREQMQRFRELAVSK